MQRKRIKPVCCSNNISAPTVICSQSAKKKEVISPASRLRESVLEVLKKEGYILGYEKYNVRAGIDELRIQLKYFEGASVQSLERINVS